MTYKQPEALRLADELEEVPFIGFMFDGQPGTEDPGLCKQAAAELRRLHEVNEELLDIFKRIKFEQGFVCECGIEDATLDLIDAAIAKATGEQQ